MSPTPSRRCPSSTALSRLWKRALLGGVILGIAIAVAPRIADMLPVPERIAAFRDDVRTALDSIRLDDGLSEEEAGIMARVYFYNYWGLCGGAYNPRYHQGRWTFRILSGPAAYYQGDLEIEASTGRMSFVPRNSLDEQLEFPSLSTFRKDVVDHLGRRYWYARLRGM